MNMRATDQTNRWPNPWTALASLAICVLVLSAELLAHRSFAFLYAVALLPSLRRFDFKTTYATAALASALALIAPLMQWASLTTTDRFELALGLAVLWTLAMAGVRHAGSLHAKWSAEQTRFSLEHEAREKGLLLERLNLAAKAAGISMWEWDIATRRLVGDANIEAVYRRNDMYSFASGTRDFIKEVVHPDDQEQFLEVLKRSVAEDDLSCRFRHVPPDGQIGHVQIHVRVLRRPDGMPERLLGVSWDVTGEVEQAARQAQDAEAQRLLAERLNLATTTAGIIVWDRDLASGAMNGEQQLRELLGIGSRPNLRARDVIPAEDYAQIEKLLADAIADPNHDGVVTARHRVIEENGATRFIQCHRRFFRGEDGRPIRILTAAWDVTAEVEGAERLREQAEQERSVTERFNLATRAAGISSWEMDLQTLQFIWEDNRPAAIGLDHVPMGQFAQAISDAMFPEDAERRNKLIRKVVGLGLDQYTYRFRIKTPKGSVRHLEAFARIVRNEAGKPVKTIGATWDITDMVEASNELLAATQEARAANHAKGAFLANVSHEIRTPMNGILGMSGLLLDTPLDATQRDYAETIRGSANALLTVINDILDFSKIEAGKVDIERVQMNLRTNVEDVATMLSVQSAQKGVELICNLQADVPEIVYGDPQRIRQCLLNLVGNAVKFTRTGEVAVEVSKLIDRDGHPMLRFNVRDTGIGIAPEIVKTLFQPFVQADASTTRDYGGTGLGLSIVRRLIEMMGGEVGVESEVGIGSCFWFALPLQAFESQPSAAMAEVIGRRALVVDDNAAQRRFLSACLTSAGYEVTEVHDASSALSGLQSAAAAKRPFEIALIDQRLGDAEGAALGREVSADPRIANTRLLMLTTMDRSAEVQRYTSIGFAGAIAKPVRSRELIRCIDKLLAPDIDAIGSRTQPLAAYTPVAAEHKIAGCALLVEDNAVNQKVAQRFIERLGCSVEVVSNGAEAVDAFKSRSFDIVFMDLQMPVMDGFTATRHIRDFEAYRTHTPIIALTANAMMGQHERCLAAGMDGFLTKPLDVERLREMLLQFVIDRDRNDADSNHDDTHVLPDTAVALLVDLARFDDVTDNDPMFVAEILDAFETTCAEVEQEMQVALATDDRKGLERAAHKLKGAAANIHAQLLRLHAEELETCASSMDKLELDIHLTQMRLYIERTTQHLRLTRQADATSGATLRSAG
jgi:signal transduction histidine kinase/DNA-binding response OmpR family regulator